MESFGWRPRYADINLPHPPADWIFAREVDEAIPAGTVVSLHWDSGEIWPATVSPHEISFRVESDVHELIADGTGYKLFIFFPDGALTADFEWYFGRAVRVG